MFGEKTAVVCGDNLDTIWPDRGLCCIPLFTYAHLCTLMHYLYIHYLCTYTISQKIHHFAIMLSYYYAHPLDKLFMRKYR